jgi:hypothetical protein
MPRITATAAQVALAFSALVLCTTAAGAVSTRVQNDPDSPGARKCMRANGLKLSQGCLNALIAAGEVSKAEVARRAGTGK